MNNIYNTFNLRADATFEIQISHDVYWVPVNYLGSTNKCCEEIEELLLLSPREKVDNVNNLYEAIMLYQASDFSEIDDTIIIDENKMKWEHHKPGYYAVLSNKGCCSTDSNWLRYMLKNKYEEVGLFSFSRPNGSGHVLNYIYHDNQYFIIDLLPMQKKYKDCIPAETGNHSDFLKAKYYTGVLVKCKSLQAYVKFFKRLQWRGGFEHLFFQQKNTDACPISVREQTDYITILYPNNESIIPLCDDTNYKTLKYEFISPPSILPDWSLTIDE